MYFLYTKLHDMRYLLFLLFTFFTFLNASIAFAEQQPSDQIFQAKVVKILEETDKDYPDGSHETQQNILFKGLEGEFKGDEFTFYGIGAYDVAQKQIYKEGDRVLALRSEDDTGEAFYYIVDYVRTGSLKWLFIAFVLTLLAVGKWKGARSLISLALSFSVIIYYVIPQILTGTNPLFITFSGGIIVFAIMVYITEGWKTRSHIALASVSFSLSIALLIAWIMVDGARITGIGSEETASLLSFGQGMFNFQWLFLAGVIIGALGVLDDVIISQVVAVEEIRRANSALDKRALFKQAMRIGVSHISSMTNTLFLVYAGASFQLLILIAGGGSGFTSFGQFFNTEQVASEIIRALAGSIALIVSVPIATFLAVVSKK